MKELKITKGDWKWQKFGDEYYLTGQHGMRPMVLATLDGKIAVREDGLLEKLHPEHPDAQAIVTAVNNTYHKGIDPEGVPDMKEALINARKELITAYKIIGNSCIKDSQIEVENALQKAGATINEKAE